MSALCARLGRGRSTSGPRASRAPRKRPARTSRRSSLDASTCALLAKSRLLIMHAIAWPTCWLSRSLSGGPRTRKTKRTGGGLTPSSRSVIWPRSTARLSRTKTAACSSRKDTVPASTSHASSRASLSSANCAACSSRLLDRFTIGCLANETLLPDESDGGSTAGGIVPAGPIPPAACCAPCPPLAELSLSESGTPAAAPAPEPCCDATRSTSSGCVPERLPVLESLDWRGPSSSSTSLRFRRSVACWCCACTTCMASSRFS